MQTDQSAWQSTISNPQPNISGEESDRLPSSLQAALASFSMLETIGAVVDDNPDNQSTQAILGVNGQINGSINYANDRDWFAINLQAGQRYTFNLDPTGASGLSDPYLRLYNASGSLLAEDDDSGTGYASQLNYTGVSTGTYYLSAGGFGSAVGNYTLRSAVQGQADDYAGNASTNARLNPGSSATGQIEIAGDKDWFAITLAAGSRYTFSLNGSGASSLGDPYLALYNSAGTQLTANDDFSGLNSQIVFDAVSAGTYYLSAQGFGSHTGSYAISASPGTVLDDYAGSTGTLGRINPGSSVSGNIEVANDHDWFAISLTAGQRYTFNLNATASGGLGDSYLRLYSAQGVQLAANDDFNGLNSQITFTATSSGTHFLDAGGFGSSTGRYTLVSSAGSVVDDYAGNSSTAGRLVSGGSSTGIIEQASDNDWFAIQLTAGSTYTFNLDSAASGGLGDTYLSLYNASGVQLLANDDYNGLNSQITYTASGSGTYYLGARGYAQNTGAYTLRASSGTPTSQDDYAATTATAGRITVGGSVAGNIGSAGDQDWFAVTLAAGTAYRFNLDPGSGNALSDTYLRLRDAQGNILASNDDANGSTASQINFNAATGGTYYLDASGFASSVGNYRLSASNQGVVGGVSGGGTNSDFDIDISFTGSSQYLSYFTEAAARWSEIIIGDLPNMGTVDDLRITASVEAIDGVNNILAQAGATALRSDSLLPYAGIMRFDSADVAAMISQGTFADVVLHEMGHVLGIANFFFERFGLVSSADPTQYTGTSALAQYRNMVGNGAAYVPLEDGGGPGTALSHFEETIFDQELMTGYSENTPPMPLSVLTIGILEDLGYHVNYTAADSFSL